MHARLEPSLTRVRSAAILGYPQKCMGVHVNIHTVVKLSMYSCLFTVEQNSTLCQNMILAVVSQCPCDGGICDHPVPAIGSMDASSCI